MNESSHLSVQKQSQNGKKQTFDQVERSSAKDDVSVEAVDHWVDCVAGVNNSFQRHDFRIEWDQHKFVGQRSYDGNCNRACQYRQNNTFGGRFFAEDGRGNQRKAAENDHICQLTDAAGMAGEHLNQVFDDGDIDGRQWTIDKAHNQNRNTAEVKLQKRWHEWNLNPEEHQDGGDCSKHADECDHLCFGERTHGVVGRNCVGHKNTSLSR